MADFASDIAASRDRITKLLDRNSGGFSDVNDALSAVAGRSTSFGEALNGIRASRIRNELGMFKTLADIEESQARREDAKNLAKMRDDTMREIARMRADNSSGQQGMGVKEYEYWKALPEPEQRAFLMLKRAMQPQNLGGSIAVPDPLDPTKTIAERAKTLPPQDTPEVRGAQRGATERAESLQKKQDNMPKAQTALTQWERKVKTVTDNVDKALSLAEKSYTATGWGNYLSALPNTDARALNNYLDTIRANLGFDELQKMRDNSPTGGALGQVTEFENRLLQAVQAALDPKQADQLVDNLKVIKKLYPQVLEDRKRAFAADFKDVMPQTTAPASVGDLSPEEAAELEELRKGQR